MGYYKDIETISSVLSVALAVLAGDYARIWLENIIVSGEGVRGKLLVLALVLCIVVVLSQISEIIIKRIINCSKTVRKVLLGRQYLEGTWIDKTQHMKDVVGYGIIEISSDSDSIYINGQSFSKDFRAKGAFTGHTNAIEWPEITFVQSGGNDSGSVQGFKSLHILENNGGVPNHWTGTFSDQLDEDKEGMGPHLVLYSTEAWKVTDKNIINKLNSPEYREKTLKALINNFFKSD